MAHSLKKSFMNVSLLIDKDWSSFCRHSILRLYQVNHHQSPKPDWNRAVSDAEKIVGYPTSYLTLRSLFSDEMSNIAVHLRKLVGSSHPLLKTAKRLVYNGRNNMQTRGLIVLLISKAAGQGNTDLLDQEILAGVSEKQRSLAEITEMIHTAHLIHKGIVTLSPYIYSDGTTLSDMEFGNKMAILSGDYLLANACTGLAALRKTEVVELVSSAITDFIEAEFCGKRDIRDNFLPSLDMTIEDWEEVNYLAAGSLMAKSCKSAMLLNGHPEDVQEKAFQFGKLIALAWQVHSDLQPFIDVQRQPPGTSFSFASSPVIFHLSKNNPDPFLKIVNSTEGETEGDINFSELHKLIVEGGGVLEAKRLCINYAESALKILEFFPLSDARTALQNIINALRDV